MDKGDAFWIRPMKTTLKVEQWYSLLQDHLSVAGNGNRVVIVEDFHTANAVMANAMLKTIEEPPEQVILQKKAATGCTSSLLRTRLTPYCLPSFLDVWELVLTVLM